MFALIVLNKWGLRMGQKHGCKGRIEHATISEILYLFYHGIVMSAATVLFDLFDPLETRITCSDIERF